jgi:VWFA-related protein
MRGFWPALPLLALAILASCTTLAQQPAGSEPFLPDASTYTVSKRVDEVNLVFSVTDRWGHFVSRLPAESFAILDNHLPPEHLNYFQQQSDLPLRVALLVDLSDSVEYRFKFEQQGATAFLKRVLRSGKDRAFVVGFDSHIHLMQDFTGDTARLEKSINAMKTGGDTALYDSLIFAARKLADTHDTRLERYAIVLITDGMDTKSRAHLQDAEHAMISSGAVLFALTTNYSSGLVSPGDKILDQLSAATGGRVLRAADKSELQAAFQQAEITLRNQYVVGYRPADLRYDGGFRPIEIRALRPHLKVRSRKGYFTAREALPQ